MSALSDLLGGTQTSSTDSTATSGLGGKVYVGPKTVKGIRGGSDVTIDDTTDVTSKINEFYKWTDAQYNAFVNKLKSQNYISKTGKTDPGTVRDIWVSAVNEAATYYSATGGAKKITVDTILNMYAKGDTAGTAPNEPSRNIYQYKKEDIYTLIDTVYQTTIGRAATEEEKAKAYIPLEQQINKGTLSTTKEVFNKETGKKETVTTQTPGFSTDDAKAQLEKELQKTNPLEYQRRKAFEFSDELNKILAGGA